MGLWKKREATMVEHECGMMNEGKVGGETNCKSLLFFILRPSPFIVAQGVS